MDFTLPAHIDSYRKRYRAFVAEHLLPLERDASAYDEHENIRLEVLEQVRAKAKTTGLWAPQMPKERGGQGLNIVAMAACYEEMNYSIFGPATFNCAAPDDGNMIVLNKVGTEPQKKR
ncbi:MAG: acyl-CoA dehydrogenase family protein, partial [Betaproteobacteria bacterium]|nr:acyl-CoA dehydrogenase family protein [Betaproteobacteria bacterium]